MTVDTGAPALKGFNASAYVLTDPTGAFDAPCPTVVDLARRARGRPRPAAGDSGCRRRGPAVVGDGPQTVADVYRYLEDPAAAPARASRPPHADLRPYAGARAAAADVTEPRRPRPERHLAERQLAAQDLRPAGRRARRLPRRRLRRLAAGRPRRSRTPGSPTSSTTRCSATSRPRSGPDDPPKVPRDVNPTGAYVRTVDLPADWAGDRVFLRFEGVTSGYLVWVNGGYVGYDQGGYTPAEFDVTERLRPGREPDRRAGAPLGQRRPTWRTSTSGATAASSATSGCTAPRRPGCATPTITTDLDAAYRDATLQRPDRRRPARPAATPCAARLRRRARPDGDHGDRRGRRPPAEVTLTAPVADPAKWSAEEPNLYTLVLELLGPGGRALHTTAQPSASARSRSATGRSWSTASAS